MTHEEVRQAAERTRPHLHRTPVLGSRILSARVGCRLHLKAELFQRTGSFKPRGGLNEVLQLPAAARSRGVITISAGNHAQGVAYAARLAEVPATVVMPSHAVRSKIEATRGYGAEVVLAGDVHEAFRTVERLRAERDLYFIHPFDSPRLIAGHGTLGLELIEDLPELNAVVVPIGGGGLIAGIAAALRTPRSRVRIYGVEPEGAPTMTRALAAGAPVRLESVATIADGLAPPFVGELNLEHVRRQVEEVVLVSDDEIRAALRLLMTRAKLFVEPSGAAALAALLAGKIPVLPGWDVAAIVSGGNVDIETVSGLVGVA